MAWLALSWCLAAGGGAALAQNYVKPGDTVEIPVLVKNLNDSGGTMNNVQVTVSDPSGFVTNAAPSAADSIPKGTEKTFKPSFVVGDVPDGTCTATLKAVIDDIGIDPDPDDPARALQLSFIADNTPPFINMVSVADKFVIEGSQSRPPVFVNTARPRISVTFSDALSGVSADSVKLFLDGAEVSLTLGQIDSGTVSHYPAADISDGQHILRMFTKDNAGNEVDSAVTFTVDHTRALIRVRDDTFGDVGEVTGADHLSVSGQDLAPGSGVAEITLTQTEGGNYHEEHAFPAFPAEESWRFPSSDGTLQDGSYRANVTDAAGNVSSSTFYVIRGKMVLENLYLSLPLPTGIPPGMQTVQRRYTFQGSNSFASAPWLWHTGRFTLFGDLSAFTVYGDDGPVWSQAFPPDTPLSVALLTLGNLPQKTGYLAVATERGGQETRVYFNRDGLGPRVQFTQLAVSGCGSVGVPPGEANFSASMMCDSAPQYYTVEGQATDNLSGVHHVGLAQDDTGSPQTGAPLALEKDFFERVDFRPESEGISPAFTQDVIARDLAGLAGLGQITAWASKEQDCSAGNACSEQWRVGVLFNGTSNDPLPVEPGLAVEFERYGVHVLLSNVSGPGGLDIAQTQTPPTPGYYPVSGWSVATTASHAGPVYLAFPFPSGPPRPGWQPLSESAQRHELRLLHLGSDGAWEDITSGGVEDGQISGRLERLGSIFAIAVTTREAAVLADQTPPVTSLRGEGYPPALRGLDGVLYASTATAFALEAYDPTTSTITAASGVQHSYYRVDDPAGAFVQYDFQPFPLQLGSHQVWYRSTDNAGNVEAPQRTPVEVTNGYFVGSGAPGAMSVPSRSSTTLDLAWTPGANPEGSLYVIEVATACGAVPQVYGSQELSGRLAGLSPDTEYSVTVCGPGYYLGESSPCRPKLVVRTAGAGSADEPSPQTHACGGQGGGTGGQAGGLSGVAIAAGPDGALWEVIASTSAVSLAKFDASGQALASVVLPGASEARWTLQVGAEAVYAIGTAVASGSPRLAVFKASLDAQLISTALAPEAPGEESFAQDASSDLWITGGIAVTQPQESATLGLWRYVQATGQIERVGLYGRGGGFDLGGAVRVFGGDVWVAGVSRPAGATVFDLGFWHFSTAGALLAPPLFLPGYFGASDKGQVRLETVQGRLYAVADRARQPDSADLGLIALDADGGISFEKRWQPAAGAALPVALRASAGGELVVAGTVISGNTAQPAAWRYAPSGELLAAEAATTPLGAPQDAALLGTDLWLALASFSSPIRFVGVPLSGQDILLSSRAAGPALAVSPSSGPIGIPFELDGLGFGPYAGANTRARFGTLLAPVSVWNDTTIKGTVPGLSSGTYHVSIERQHPSSMTVLSAGEFRVLLPSPASVEPSSAPIGAPFTITGSAFGSYAGSLSRVLIAGTTAPVSLWNDTTIKGTIPGVASGVQTIVIERETGGYIARSAQSQLEVLTPNLVSFQPEAGPIGIAFTATGAGFGPYGGTLTRILIGGATSAVSLWNDTTIKGTVPGGLTPGAQEVVVERATAGGGLSRSAPLTFQLELPTVYSFSPSSGPIGVPFTLIGTDFGNYTGSTSRVKFGGVVAPVSLWTNTTIQGTIPGVLPGAQEILIERQSGTNTMTASVGSFLVLTPQVNSVSPSSGPIGVPFTITGQSFGPYAGTSTRVLFAGMPAAVSLWNDTTISGSIPGVAPGNQTVVVERTTADGGLSRSSTAYFEVTVPSIISVSPSSGPIGITFTVMGNSFGPYAGTNTLLRIGGSTAAVSLWNDTIISGTVPGTLTPGLYPLIVERKASDGTVVQSAPGQFQVAGMMVTLLNPATGPLGIPFTITGTEFGTYGGANTRVKFGGVVAPVSLWNDTTIKGTIPALPAGGQAVLVERQNGSNVSSAFGGFFTVAVPTVTGVSPSSGPIGLAFTIAGQGFGPYAGTNTRVRLGGALSPISVWNDTTISGTVPGATPGGVQTVLIERAVTGGLMTADTFYFEVTIPAVASLTPSSAPIGAPFTIIGQNFGAYLGANSRVTIGGVAAPISLWNDTTIKGTIPGAAAAGAQPVLVERLPAGGTVSSSAGIFTVLVPQLNAITPTWGQPGAAFTLTGFGFGPYAGTASKAKVGGIAASISLWNDTTIKGIIPSSLSVATYPVVVERTPAGGSIVSNVLEFAVGSGPVGPASLGVGLNTGLKVQPDSYYQAALALPIEEGGRVEAPSHASLTLPPAALDELTELTLGKAESTGLRAQHRTEALGRATLGAAGQAIEFGPSGTRFTVPVTIELPYDPSLVRPGQESQIAVHHWNEVAGRWEALPSEVDRLSHSVRARTDHFSLYQPLVPGNAIMVAAVDESFGFKDLYAFPNPVRGGRFITIRVQPGHADSIEVHVYDASGAQVHSGSVYSPQIVDDGNGKGNQYTFDYAWETSSVGSGVYTYAVTARKAGMGDIRKLGKLAVLR